MIFKKYLIIIMCIAIGVYLWTEPLYTPTAISSPANKTNFPRIIAHKALVSGKFKNNTLDAIQEAVASEIDGIEVDLRTSKDDVLFLYHDDFFEDSSKPEDYNWKQIQEKNATIASLEEVFKIVGSKKYLFLDVKNANAVKLVELIHKYHLQETVVVESFDPIFLTKMRLKARNIILMYDFAINTKAIGEESQEQFDRIPWILKQPFVQKQIRRIVRPDILGPRWNIDTKLLKTLIANNYPVISWTVDDIIKANQLFAIGVKGIQTNKPIELIKAIKPEIIQCDAGGTESQVDLIHVKNTTDVINAINKARITKRKITIAGRKHSQGGQTLLKDSIHLDMMGINQVIYNSKDQTVTVSAGATWRKIQSILNEHGRSVKVMQSDNIFTVGGSISANVHGWQVGSQPISSTIESMKIITTDGVIKNVVAQDELFKAVVGGYGQFGVILEATLATVANSELKFSCEFMKPEIFAAKFEEHITKNPSVELAYGRLSVDRDHLFEEVGLFWYERIKPESFDKIIPEPFVALKRMIFRASQYAELGKLIRWSAEKFYARKIASAKPISRNNAMNTDIHILWPLYESSKDILHEYFIPKTKLHEFLTAAKQLILNYDMNILNVTIREVKKDNISLLAYANQDVFGLVFLFSQSYESEEVMKNFTQKLIDEVIKLNGTFYLPYRLHYTKTQLLACYPNINKWLDVKQSLDKSEILSSQFFEYLSSVKLPCILSHSL